MPSEFCAATSVTEIESPFEIAFLSSLVILWDRYCCDSSCNKGFWCLRAHGLLEMHHRAEQSGLGCALLGCWQIPRAAGLQSYRPESISRNHPDQPQPTSSQLLYLLGLEILQQEEFYKCLTVWNFCILPSMELIYKRSFLNEKSASLILLFCLMKNRLEISF